MYLQALGLPPPTDLEVQGEGDGTTVHSKNHSTPRLEVAPGVTLGLASKARQEVTPSSLLPGSSPASLPSPVSSLADHPKLPGIATMDPLWPSILLECIGGGRFQERDQKKTALCSTIAWSASRAEGRAQEGVTCV